MTTYPFFGQHLWNKQNQNSSGPLLQNPAGNNYGQLIQGNNNSANFTTSVRPVPQGHPPVLPTQNQTAYGPTQQSRAGSGSDASWVTPGGVDMRTLKWHDDTFKRLKESPEARQLAAQRVDAQETERRQAFLDKTEGMISRDLGRFGVDDAWANPTPRVTADSAGWITPGGVDMRTLKFENDTFKRLEASPEARQLAAQRVDAQETERKQAFLGKTDGMISRDLGRFGVNDAWANPYPRA